MSAAPRMRREAAHREGTMSRSASLLIALLAVAAPAAAQQLYRCGNTYSQTPCSAEARPARLFQGQAPEKAPGPTGFELCAAAAGAKVSAADPDGVRVQPLGPRVSEVIQFAGQPLSAHRYDLAVDTRTAYGGYAGPVAYSCWVSEDQARVLQFGLRKAP